MEKIGGKEEKKMEREEKIGGSTTKKNGKKEKWVCGRWCVLFGRRKRWSQKKLGGRGRPWQEKEKESKKKKKKNNGKGSWEKQMRGSRAQLRLPC